MTIGIEHGSADIAGASWLSIMGFYRLMDREREQQEADVGAQGENFCNGPIRARQ